MPDIQELSDADMSVVERMKSLPDDVLFGEEQPDTKAGQERSDDPEAPDEIRDGPEASEEEVEAGKAKGTEQDDDPEFEIADPEGGEPRKVKLSELIEAEREFTAFKEEKAQILTRVQEAAQQEAQGMVQQTRSQMTQVGYQLRAALEILRAPQPPQPPPPDVTNQYSPNYNPDAVQNYLLARATHEQQMGLYNTVQQMAAGFGQYQQQLDAQRDEREFGRLTAHWPEFTDDVKGPATQQQFMADMNKHYKFTPMELDAVLVDHRQAIVARDALKWREHLAKQSAAKVTVKDKVEKKASAKVAGSAAAKQTLTTEQSNYMNARKALKANGKDMNAAAKGMLRFL